MQAMNDSMQVFDLQALKPRALAAVLDGRGEATTRTVALALAVPFWVADVLLDALQEAGEVLGTPACAQMPGACRRWRLTLSAGMALALTVRVSPRAVPEQVRAAVRAAVEAHNRVSA